MNDLINRQDVIEVLATMQGRCTSEVALIQNSKIWQQIKDLPSAQPDIKQAAKLLLNFIENCPGGDSYLITPDGEELRTDWGYAMEGIQLIYDWVESEDEK